MLCPCWKQTICMAIPPGTIILLTCCTSLVDSEAALFLLKHIGTMHINSCNHLVCTLILGMIPYHLSRMLLDV